MNISELASTVAKYVPAVANAIVPGAGSLIALIAQEFGADPTNEQDIIAKINASSDAQLKLQEVYENCKVQIQQINANIALAEISAKTAVIQSDQADRADARATASASKSKVQAVLTIFLSISMVGIVSSLFMCGFPSDTNAAYVLIMLISQVSNGFGMCLAFFLGTSASSVGKDDKIFNSIPIEKSAVMAGNSSR